VGSKNRGLISPWRRHPDNLKPEQRLRLLTYLAERPVLDVIYCLLIHSGALPAENCHLRIAAYQDVPKLSEARRLRSKSRTGIIDCVLSFTVAGCFIKLRFLVDARIECDAFQARFTSGVLYPSRFPPD